MLKQLILAILILVPAARSACASEIEMRADRIRTWTRDEVQTFLLEGQARITGERGSFSADAMVVWLDRAQAKKAGVVGIMVYSESAGAAGITQITGASRLVLDSAALLGTGRPQRSGVFERARAARMKHLEASAAPAPVDRALGKALGAPSGEPVTIEYAPIDSDGYEIKMEEVDGKAVVVLRGGIELRFADYSMRARHIVLWRTPGEGDKATDFEVYAEGDVSFRTPAGTLEASRMFFHHASRRALLLDAALYARLRRPDVPLVMRAKEIRAISERSFVAKEAYVTTCEFGIPHYRIQSRQATLTTVTGPEGVESANLVARGNRIFLSELPVMWLPNISRDVKDTHLPLRRLEMGESNDFGAYVRTQWDILDLLAGNSSESVAARVSHWGDLTGRLDYLDKRGPGGGVDFDYDGDEVAGNFLGYYINDRGTDADGFLPTSQHRWRIKWRQRAFLESLQIDTELSDISDRGFLREYYEKEFKEGKEQESYLYLKHPWENAQGTLTYRARVNDFQSQTEYLPEARFDVVALPVFDGKVVYTSSSRAGNLRFSPDKDTPLGSFQTQRVDSMQEIAIPLQSAGGFTVTPFASARGTWYDEDTGGDGVIRYVAGWGAKVAFPALWKVWDAKSELFDIDRLRHVVALDFTYESTYDATRTPSELLQFDEVDAVDTTDMATIRLKQRLQTKRPSATPDAAERTVDLATLETEADFFPDPRSDNAGDPWSDVRFYARGNVTDDFAVLGDADYDPSDGKVNTAGVWVRVDHSPRTTWSVGSRYQRAISETTLVAELSHEISDRWAILFLGQFDLDEKQVLDETFVLRRNLHRFTLEFAVDYDRGRDDTSVAVKIYPTGMPGRREYF